MNASIDKKKYGLPDEENPEWTDEDFAQAKANRFAQRTVILDEDVAKYFPADKEVNEVLRTIIQLTQHVHVH